MAAVNFPNNPSVNDTHTSSGSTWKWDGGVWQRLGVAGPQGAQGRQGAVGAQGAQGVQGAVNNLSIATSPPGSPTAGDLWWDSDDGDLHTYFNDGNSSQWVNINNGPAGAQGAQGHQGVQGAANATTINSNANNKVITGSGSANTLEAEASLTFDAGLLKIDDLAGTAGKGRLEFGNSGEQYIEGYDTGNAGSGSYLAIGSNTDERIRIDSGGRLLMGSAANSHNGGDLIQLSATSSTASIQLNRYTANAHPSYINFFKSRNASISGQTVVQNGDTLGMLAFYGSDGSDRALGAEVCAQVDGTPGSNDMPSRLVFRTSADGSQSPSERLRIDSTGRLLLNTTTEGNAGADDLTIGQISGSTGITIRSGTTNNGNLYFSDGTSGNDEFRGSIQYQHANNSLHIATNAVERLIIDSTGQLQATSAADVRLTLGSSGTAGTNNSVHIRADSADLKFMAASGGNTIFERNGTESLRIASDGVAHFAGDVKVLTGDVIMGNGRGVNFAANTDGGGTSSATTLEDYESGSYSSSIVSANCTLDNDSGTGYYIKVGNMVYVRGLFSMNTNSGSPSKSGSTNIVQALPYTPKSGGTSMTGTMIVENINSQAPTSAVGHPLWYNTLPSGFVCLAGSNGIRFYINKIEAAFTRMNNSHLNVGYPGYTWISWNITYETS